MAVASLGVTNTILASIRTRRWQYGILRSIGLTRSTIDNSILWPLPLTVAGFTCLFGAAVLMRIRAELAETKVEARLRRMGGE